MSDQDTKRILRLAKIYSKNISILDETRPKLYKKKIRFFKSKIKKLNLYHWIWDNLERKEEILYIKSRKTWFFCLPLLPLSSLSSEEIDREVLQGFEKSKNT